jgi:hypothetical protein
MQFLIIAVAAIAVLANFVYSGGRINLPNKQNVASSQTIEQSVRGASTGGTDPALGFAVKLSDNYGKISISGISLKSINLTANLRQGESLNISGWKIVGKNREFVLPQAAKIYPFSGAPVNTLVVSGENIYIQTDVSPLGTSLAFKPNKCFGYLGPSSANFPYSYQKICPRINENDICNFSEACRQLILSLNSCTQPAFSMTEYPYCWEYISDYVSKNLNYSSCVNNYVKDSDFFGSTWYVYTNFLPICDCGDDTIYLYDRYGLLVAKQDYNL